MYDYDIIIILTEFNSNPFSFLFQSKASDFDIKTIFDCDWIALSFHFTHFLNNNELAG